MENAIFAIRSSREIYLSLFSSYHGWNSSIENFVVCQAREDFTFEAVDYDSDVTHEAEELKEDLRSTVLGKVPDSLLIALSSVSSTH